LVRVPGALDRPVTRALLAVRTAVARRDCGPGDVVSARLLFPELGPDERAEGWLPDLPTLTSAQVLGALGRRHPMDGVNGMPGRWVFCREVQASTGAYADVQRFDAVAVGLVPSTKYARVVYEVKVSRSDWLRELRPVPDVRDAYGRLGGMRAAAVARNAEAMPNWQVSYRNKWDAALAVSTEFWIAAAPRCIQLGELPPEAGLLEVRLWGKDREPRAKVVRSAPVRQTAMPDAGFWAAVLRRAAAR
jgi:hypothetical protein